MHCRVKGDFFLGLSHNCEGSRGRFGPSKNTNCEKKEPKRPTMKKTAPKKLGINSQKKTIFDGQRSPKKRGSPAPMPVGYQLSKM